MSGIRHGRDTTDYKNWVSRVACVNCRYYQPYWCVWHDTPTCPWARCDRFKEKRKSYE